MNIFNRISKSEQEKLFYEGGVIGDNGRLTKDGQETFVDLLFIGKTIEEAKKLMQEEIVKEKKERKQ